MSTHTSITPSPSHLTIRTPRREQMSRRRARNAVSTSTARSSPSSSVNAVKPETSTKAKLRCTRTSAYSHVSRPPAQFLAPAGTGWWRPGGPPTMAPWRRGGQLDGKIVLVSGGASDIGRATALRLAGAGAAVVVGDVSIDGAASVAEEVEGAGGRAIGVLCDVRREESVAAFVERAVAEFGTVDAVDHNAAWSHPRLDTDAVGVDLGVWERAIEITTRGALLLARHAIPVMAAGGGGSIVTISSGTSTIGESTRVAYGVAKAGAEPADAPPGRPLRPRRHSRQRHRTRVHPHGDGGGPGAGRRADAAGRGQPDPASRHTRRHRPRGRVPLQRRCGLRQRTGAPCRRRAPDRRDDVDGRG